MQETIENSSRQNMVVEDLAPVQEAFVTGDDQAGLFIAVDDQAEEQAGILMGKGHIADFVDDEHLHII